jgi:probable phosphoglycerate mutase
MTIKVSSYLVKRPDVCTIFLLRHGAIESPGAEKHFIGQLDLPLEDIGRDQAHWWASSFSDIRLEEIYSSDLSRCLETAQIIGDRCTLEPKALADLREISLGAWEGYAFDKIKALYPEEFIYRGDHIFDHRPPGGECFRDLQARVWPIFHEIMHRHTGRVLIVTHAGVIRVLICRLLGIPPENLFSIGLCHGAMNIIRVRPNGYRVQALNLLPTDRHRKKC